MLLSTPFSRLGRPLLLRFAVLVISMPILQIMLLWLYFLSLCRMHITSPMLLSSVHGFVRRLCPSPTQVLMSNHVIISLSRGAQDWDDPSPEMTSRHHYILQISSPIYPTVLCRLLG